jgi:SAM-dependent methyltransferase
MQILFWVFFALVLLFGFVVIFGAPYLPTLKKQTAEALDLLDLKPGQTLLELGCGDGRVVKAAAQRGLKVTGYELNPILVIIAKLNTIKYRGQTKLFGEIIGKKTGPRLTVFLYFYLINT